MTSCGWSRSGRWSYPSRFSFSFIGYLRASSGSGHLRSSYWCLSSVVYFVWSIPCSIVIHGNFKESTRYAFFSISSICISSVPCDCNSCWSTGCPCHYFQTGSWKSIPVKFPYLPSSLSSGRHWSHRSRDAHIPRRTHESESIDQCHFFGHYCRSRLVPYVRNDRYPFLFYCFFCLSSFTRIPRSTKVGFNWSRTRCRSNPSFASSSSHSHAFKRVRNDRTLWNSHV